MLPSQISRAVQQEVERRLAEREAQERERFQELERQERERGAERERLDDERRALLMKKHDELNKLLKKTLCKAEKEKSVISCGSQAKLIFDKVRRPQTVVNPAKSLIQRKPGNWPWHMSP